MSSRPCLLSRDKWNRRNNSSSIDKILRTKLYNNQWSDQPLILNSSSRRFDCYCRDDIDCAVRKVLNPVVGEYDKRYEEYLRKNEETKKQIESRQSCKTTARSKETHRSVLRPPPTSTCECICIETQTCSCGLTSPSRSSSPSSPRNQRYEKRPLPSLPEFGIKCPKRKFRRRRMERSPPPRERKKDIQDICDIRKEHFFETHCLDDFYKDDVPEHKCIHQFVLDEYLIPKPLNSNSFGISRCKICGKPMVCPKARNEDTRETQRSSVAKTHIRQLLEPRVVHLGGRDVDIELLIKDDEGYNNCIEEKKKPCKGFPRLVYTDTMALRQQKGVGWM